MQRLALVVLIAACRSDGTLSDQPTDDAAPNVSPDAPPTGGICAEATQHSDFAWIQQNVFTPSCTGRSCHHANDEGYLSLVEGEAYAELVNQDTDTVSGWTRVVPGSPSTSYLLVALGRAPGPPPSDGFMPLLASPLCKENLDAIERWIAQGALP